MSLIMPLCSNHYMHPIIPCDANHITSTHIANAVGGLPVAIPPQILLHRHHGCAMLFGRHDGLVAHYAGRWVLAGAHVGMKKNEAMLSALSR